MQSILTVTVPAASRLLTSLNAIKAELGISNAALDDVLLRHITEASGRIEDYCGRVFAEQTYSELFRGVYAPQLLTAQTPLSITSVTEDGVALSASDYEADEAAGIIYRLSFDERVAWCADKVTVVYDAGYVLASATPSALESACIALVKAKWFARLRDPLLRSEDVFGVGRNDYWVNGSGGDMPGDVESMLAAWRRLLI